MKYIEKLPKNEPISLKLYRNTTPNKSYSGYQHPVDLKTSLLKEQGGICAYCMQRISLDLNEKFKPKIEVEHIKSQINHPAKSLDYNNMVGVCNGNVGGKEHCDKSKKSNDLKKLIPTDRNCENLITYSRSGEIKSKSNNREVVKDLNEILNLNNQNLIDNRKLTIDLIVDNIKKKHPNTAWTKRIFEKEIEFYESRNRNGEYFEFYNYIVWFLNELKRSPRYP